MNEYIIYDCKMNKQVDGCDGKELSEIIGPTCNTPGTSRIERIRAEMNGSKIPSCGNPYIWRVY
jgi:hypothetical protein